MSNKIYIDCNRTNSLIKSDTQTNEWTTQLIEGIRVPKGSTIKLNNTLINYKGLQGESIEISEDTALSFSLAYYISHSDFMVPTAMFKDISAPTHDTFKENTGLKTTMTDCFVEVRPESLMSEFLADGLGTVVNDLISGYMYGYTEQPLFAVRVGTDGKMIPVTDLIYIPISKGVYGITQLINIINDYINGSRIPTGTENYKSNQQINYEAGAYYSAFTQSKFLKHAQAWPYTPNDFINDIETQSLESIIQATGPGKCLLFVTTKEFNNLMNSYANENGGNIDDSWLWENWKNNNYYASIKKRFFSTGLRAQKDGVNVYVPTTDKVTIEGVEETYQYWDWNPLDDGYYVGTSDFVFNYDTLLNNFSFQFLHSPRRIDVFDRIGGRNDKAGEIVTYIKKDATLLDKIINIGDSYAKSAISSINNSITNPRQRNGGVIIYNFDFTNSLSNNTIGINTNAPSITRSVLYKRYDDFFKSSTEAGQAWKKTLLYQLGFNYEQLNNTNNFEISRSYDLQRQTLYGLTTNNIIDTTTQNTIATLYCPQQSDDNTDYINFGYTVLTQVKLSDMQNTNRCRYGISEHNYKTWKYVYYSEMLCIPILTGSSSINGKRLPTLSKIGYFIVTSDIMATNDIVKNSNMPLLGVVPKSNLSNQDFMASYTDIIHQTTQDIALNKINIKILNSDLTVPDLDPYSSVIIEITLPLNPVLGTQ